MRLELPLQGAWGCFICLEGVSKLKQKRAFSPHYLHFDTPSCGRHWAFLLKQAAEPITKLKIANGDNSKLKKEVER